ncbi:MAG: YfhO family protein [Muribaculaceae bacterium]|nr:YfhO family protein [Muribaculaceae bacterium]
MIDKIKQWCLRPQVWGSAISVVVMALVAFFFFYPDNVEGNTLRQYDMMQGAANGHEAQVYREQTGEQALWTDALFGGMPTFQISPSYPSNSLFSWIDTVYGLGLPAPSNLLFMMMAGFFILLMAMRQRWWYALIGAVAWGLSSYFVIIIGAGHIWKFVTLAYVPPTIAGLVMVYRGRYITGGSLLALFAMMQLNANHPQMTYYFGFVMFGLVVAWLVSAVREGRLRRWCAATAVSVVCGALAIGANLPSLYNTYEYSKETKRSQSELTPLPSSEADPDAPRPTGGMPYGEIVGWSYGTSETFTLLVPNIKGGATAKPEGGGMVHMGLDRLDGAADYAGRPAADLLPYLPQYFNDSEGTNGPVYVGAVILALFLVGCVLVRGPEKWALLVLTVFSIVLAWGSNFPALTDLFIYNVPLYNKFRAVESILVIAEFTIPLLAILGLSRLMEEAGNPAARRTVAWCFGACAVVALAAALAPSLFGRAITTSDTAVSAQMSNQVAQLGAQYGYSQAEVQQMAYEYSINNPEMRAAIEDLRYGMVRADGWRSFGFLAAGALLLWLALGGRLDRRVAVGALGVLVLSDLYGVDKRYVDHASFVAVSDAGPEFSPDAIDQLIMQDTTHYRVMDIPGFWRPNRSYYHHTVGGYHAAKLNRYEDLIQRRLQPVLSYGYHPEFRDDSIRVSLPDEQQPVAESLAASYRMLDMLNARYIITGDKQAPVLLNTNASGPAWLVPGVEYVKDADAEMEALASLDPRREAVADERFAQALGRETGSLAPGDTVSLVSYTPNRVEYLTDTRTSAVAVFSEVWFPWGWKATIDGRPAELGRVNYLLRALRVPAGRHEVVMTFDPDSLHITGGVAYAAVSIIYMLVLLAMFVNLRRHDF